MQQGSNVLFTQFPHEFWDQLDSAAEIVVLLRILKNIGFEGRGVCFESRDSMCRACHITKNTLRSAIEGLEDKQIIVVDQGSNRPHKITLHENVAGVKIGTRNRYNIYRGSNLTSAKRRGNSDYHTLHDSEREPYSVAKRMLEDFQDERNAIHSNRMGQAQGTSKPGQQGVDLEDSDHAEDQGFTNRKCKESEGREILCEVERRVARRTQSNRTRKQ